MLAEKFSGDRAGVTVTDTWERTSYLGCGLDLPTTFHLKDGENPRMNLEKLDLWVIQHMRTNMDDEGSQHTQHVPKAFSYW